MQVVYDKDAGDIDVTKTIEIRGSLPKLLLLVLLGLVVTGLFGAFAFELFPGAPASLQPIGVVGLIFFGLCTLAWLWRLFSYRRVLVILSPQGIQDNRITEEVIDWNAIAALHSLDVHGQKFVILTLKPEAEQRLTWTRGNKSSKRRYFTSHKIMGIDGLSIGAQGLALNHKRLEDLLEAYVRAYGNL